MKPKILMSVACLALVSTGALAGASIDVPVNVDLDTRFAEGDTDTARLDADEDVRIGCGIRVLDDGAGGTFRFGFCSAEDAEGDSITCTAIDAGVLDGILYGSDYGYMTFSWDEDDVCTRIGFSNQSQYLPDEPDFNNGNGNGNGN